MIRIINTISTFCFPFESSMTTEEGLAGELWLRCGCGMIFDDRFVIHVQDLVDVDNELEEDDDILCVPVVIGVLDGQSTHEVEWRKSVGSDLNQIR